MNAREKQYIYFLKLKKMLLYKKKNCNTCHKKTCIHARNLRTTINIDNVENLCQECFPTCISCMNL